ncbi:DNRLRE domain-containing protein [Myceligenerans crystallogenes]|uniref:Concanavalin A-like lectin/glucanases superfamily protein n=1 Tax=Myceligenerans crystallogenes TaxID=316335 RepID=A0ABP4ZEW0_9MICO
MQVGPVAPGNAGSSSDGVVGRVRAAGARVRTALRSRSGAMIAGLLVLVLGAGAAAAVEPVTGRSLGEVLAADAETDPATDPTAAPADCDEPAADLPEAWVRAKACGHEVESLADRTEYRTYFGTPEGMVRQETSTAAVRSRTLDGTWTDIDTSIVPGDDGRLEVAAPGLQAISFADPSAAGADPDAPLAILRRDGHELVFDVPFELTDPVVEADRVTYPGILGDEGISLTVTPDGDGTGIREVITVDDAESASNPGLAELDFRVEVSGGLRLEAEAGGFVAEDEAGTEVFRAPQPTGWTAEGHEPAQGAQVSGGEAMEPTSSSLTAAEEDATGARAAEATTAPREPEPRTPDVVDGPGRYDAIFEMDTRVQLDENDAGRSATVRVRPDQEILTDPDTEFPVALDPSVSGTLNEFTAVKSFWPTSTSGYGFNDTVDGTHGTGLCDASDPYGWECAGATSKHRVMYEFDGLSQIRDVDAMEVNSATLQVYGTHSYNCTAHTVAAYRLGAISSATNWDNMPSWLSENRLDGVDIAHKFDECGGRKWVEFDVTQAMKDLAANNWSTMTFGLKVDETSMAYWKRYAGRQVGYGDTWTEYAPKLSVWYNRTPKPPVGRETWSIDPAKNWGCETESFAPWVPANKPRFKAKASDPDGQSVKVHFQVQRVSTGSTVWSAWSSMQTTGQVHSVRPGDEDALLSGVKYRWHARTQDSTGNTSPFSGWCYFTPDVSRPNSPTITPVDDGSVWYEAVYPDCSPGVSGCLETGGVGKTGKWRLGVNGSQDVARFEYSWGSESYRQDVAPWWPSGTHIIGLTPQAPGPMTLYAHSVDHAGNVSERATYKIDVAYPLATGLWKLDEGSGTTAYDSALTTTPQPLTLSGSGAFWADGPHELFDSGDGDNALRFDGAGAAVTDGAVVRLKDSFVVSAHLMPESAAEMTGTEAALAQEGEVGSGFVVGTRECQQDSDSATESCWSFGMYDADGGDPTWVTSEKQVLANEWTHVLAEHDAARNHLQLWVCPVGTPSHRLDGEPVATSPVTFTSTWGYLGRFTVGRAGTTANKWGHWHGRVDNVRVWDGAVVASSKIRRLCQGAGGDDFAGDVGLDPTEQIDIDE